MKIVADRAIPFLEDVLEPYARVRRLKGATITRDDVLDADALIVRTRTRCDERLLANTRVRHIASATIGSDHIDTAWCAAHGITVETAAGCNARGVLQWMGAVLATEARAGGWHPQERCLGVIGVGHTGSLTAEYAARWGFRVLRCDPPRKEVEGGDFLPLEEVVEQADILAFHVPLTRQGPYATHHLVDEPILGRLRPGTLVVNCSRGEVIATRPLVRALGKGRCRAALDVWEGEPRIDRTLLGLACIATPHIAGYTVQGKANATALAVQSVARALELPLKEFYPEGVAPAVPAPIGWERMSATIRTYFDAEALTERLRSRPDDFESLRENYPLRTEYF